LEGKGLIGWVGKGLFCCWGGLGEYKIEERVVEVGEDSLS